MSWINHLPPACWSTFRKSNSKQQLGCRFDIMDYESYFFVFWHMQLYMSWYIISFFGFTFLNIFIFSSTLVLTFSYRRNLYTFYQTHLCEIYQHFFCVCTIWDTQAFSLKNDCGFNTKSYCSDVCGYHRRPQTLAEICRNMGLRFQSSGRLGKTSEVHVIMISNMFLVIKLHFLKRQTRSRGILLRDLRCCQW